MKRPSKPETWYWFPMEFEDKDLREVSDPYPYPYTPGFGRWKHLGSPEEYFLHSAEHRASSCKSPLFHIYQDQKCVFCNFEKKEQEVK